MEHKSSHWNLYLCVWDPVSLECRDTSFCVRGRNCVFTEPNSGEYNSGLQLYVCMWCPALWLHEPAHAFQNLQKEAIQLHVAGWVEGQQPTFSRKLASKQLALRVSPHKQMVIVCTQGECYQAVIISQAAICPPKRFQWERKRKKALSCPPLNTHPIKSCLI